MEQGGTREFGVTRLPNGRVRVRHGSLNFEYEPGDVIFREASSGIEEMVLPTGVVVPDPFLKNLGRVPTCGAAWSS